MTRSHSVFVILLLPSGDLKFELYKTGQGEMGETVAAVKTPKATAATSHTDPATLPEKTCPTAATNMSDTLRFWLLHRKV